MFDIWVTIHSCLLPVCLVQVAKALRLRRYGVWTQRTLTTSSMFILQLNYIILPRFVFFKNIYSATGQFMGWFFSSSGSRVRSLQGLLSKIQGLTTSSLLNRYFQPLHIKYVREQYLLTWKSITVKCVALCYVNMVFGYCSLSLPHLMCQLWIRVKILSDLKTKFKVPQASFQINKWFVPLHRA